MSEDITQFIAELQRQEVAARTVCNYASDLLCFSRWFTSSTGEAFVAPAVTPTDIRDYKAYLTAVEHRKPATINRRLASLRKFFQWAKAEDRIQELPTDAVKGVKSVPRAPKSLEKRDVDRLIRMAERDSNKRNLAILQTLRHTGLRVGELCALKLDDIVISERKGSLTVIGKGGKHREVPLNNDVRKAIEAYLEVRPKVSTRHLFIGQRSEGLKPQAVENIVKKYARAAGLEEVSPHTLRHTFGKLVLDAGEDLVTVAKLLGHERIETTAIYTQPSQQDLEKAVEKLTTG